MNKFLSTQAQTDSTQSTAVSGWAMMDEKQHMNIDGDMRAELWCHDTRRNIVVRYILDYCIFTTPQRRMQLCTDSVKKFCFQQFFKHCER